MTTVTRLGIGEAVSSAKLSYFSEFSFEAARY